MPKISAMPQAATITEDDVLVGTDGVSTKTYSIGALSKHLVERGYLVAQPDLDLATAVTNFYKSIIAEPLTGAMLMQWKELSRMVAAVIEVNDLYVPLIERELDSKI